MNHGKRSGNVIPIVCLLLGISVPTFAGTVQLDYGAGFMLSHVAVVAVLLSAFHYRQIARLVKVRAESLSPRSRRRVQIGMHAASGGD